MASNALVQASQLRLEFRGGVTALDGVDLELAEAEFLSLVGPSGCGKSTLLRLVAGLIAPSSGRIEVAGTTPARARRDAAALSFVFQDPTLLPWRTVERNIALPLELAGAPSGQRRARVAASLKFVQLDRCERRYPRELSGGMRMRVALARALATEPRLLLVDEPFAALDDITRQTLNEELLALWRRQRFAVLFVTHNISEAVFLSQRVLVMSARPGRIVAEFKVDAPAERDPAWRGTAGFAAECARVSDALRRAAR